MHYRYGTPHACAYIGTPLAYHLPYPSGLDRAGLDGTSQPLACARTLARGGGVQGLHGQGHGVGVTTATSGLVDGADGRVREALGVGHDSTIYTWRASLEST